VLAYNSSVTVTIIVGTAYIAELIRTSCTLDVLSLSENHLGDDGIAAIAGPLGNSNLFKLILDGCGITMTGAKVLAESLTINKSLSVLTLTKNPITVEGARVIFESVVGNGAICPNLVMDNHLCDEDKEIQLMMEVLETRMRRHYNKVGAVPYCNRCMLL